MEVLSARQREQASATLSSQPLPAYGFLLLPVRRYAGSRDNVYTRTPQYFCISGHFVFLMAWAYLPVVRAWAGRLWRMETRPARLLFCTLQVSIGKGIVVYICFLKGGQRIALSLSLSWFGLVSIRRKDGRIRPHKGSYLLKNGVDARLLLASKQLHAVCRVLLKDESLCVV